MNPIYFDGNGGYYRLDYTNGDGTQVVSKRTSDGYESLPVAAGTVPGAMVVAPNLTDLGGGVWVNGLLVDPS